jgi:hypothetical protein
VFAAWTWGGRLSFVDEDAVEWTGKSGLGVRRFLDVVGGEIQCLVRGDGGRRAPAQIADHGCQESFVLDRFVD